MAQMAQMAGNITDVGEDSSSRVERELCLRKNETEYENVPVGFCPRDWDHVLCWPPTAPGTHSYQKCFSEFMGVRYDSSQNATRWCDTMGQWHKTTYDTCKELETHNSDWSHDIFFYGYFVSTITLVISVVIFITNRELRCLRNYIHTNLMCTYILASFPWIILWGLAQFHQLWRYPDGLCNALVIVLNFAYLTNFFWMFVEGLYLYMLVVQTFTVENIRLRVCLLIGWGIPIPIATAWGIAKAYEMQDVENKNTGITSGCVWFDQRKSEWILRVPILCILTINCIFLSKIMWVLVTKLTSTTTRTAAENQQYRKLAKALLVLFPLLGITYVLTISVPTDGPPVIFFIRSIRDALISTQGFIVSIFYCFFNMEVRTAIRHNFRIFCEKRRIGTKRQRLSGIKGTTECENVRLFGIGEGIGPARYSKRESGASDMTTVTYVGYCYSSTNAAAAANVNGRCRSLSNSTIATVCINSAAQAPTATAIATTTASTKAQFTINSAIVAVTATTTTAAIASSNTSNCSV